MRDVRKAGEVTFLRAEDGTFAFVFQRVQERETTERTAVQNQ